MAFILGNSRNLLQNNWKTYNIFRSLYINATLRLKEIQTKQEKDKLIISAALIPSPREPFLMNEATDCITNSCPVCTLKLDIKHTDVLILSQYVRSDGCMLPRRITGLCKKQQKRIGSMVTMAQKAGLMINLTPDNSNKDPKKRYQWKKYNKYFDETTIKFTPRTYT